MNRPLLVVGDALLDRDLDGTVHRLCPDSPAAPVVDEPVARTRPGGAALAAHLAVQSGHDVILVCPLGVADAGRQLRELIDPRVRIVALPWPDAIAQKTRVRVDGRTLLRIDDPPNPYTSADVPAALTDAIGEAGAVLVSDYAGGFGANPAVRDILREAARTLPLVWDPHPRSTAPVRGTLLATPNQAEAVTAVGKTALSALSVPDGHGAVNALTDIAHQLREAWGVSHLAITLGARGALLCGDGSTQLVPARQTAARDTCGAGDSFAVAAAAALGSGALPSEAVAEAVDAAAAFLAAGGVAAVCTARGRSFETAVDAADSAATAPTDAFSLAERVRARGGTVAATGGCFDLLHAGHVHCLRAARAAGDCLIVCLNSDDSVRRLKGPGRPLNTAADRAAILESLGCVDAVVVFDEPTPAETLRRLRPDLWVKGGDYVAEELPEAALVRSWGGRVLTVPYLSGRSTTGLVRSARAEAA